MVGICVDHFSLGHIMANLTTEGWLHWEARLEAEHEREKRVLEEALHKAFLREASLRAKLAEAECTIAGLKGEPTLTDRVATLEATVQRLVQWHVTIAAALNNVAEGNEKAQIVADTKS